MKVLIVNKFLYPNGGSETYIFEIGKQLEKLGHEVQFFGMEHKGRIVGNKSESYTADMDFHTGKLAKLMYPFKIIYSFEARKKIRVVLEQMQPDVVHLNNINFQITPSVIDEIRSFEKKTGKKIKIIMTAHDYQWVCPNHMMRIPSTNENCERCLGGKFGNCAKNKCIHNSRVKSILGTVEAEVYKIKKTYSKVDLIICPSRFLYDRFAQDKNIPKEKMVVRHNFFIKDEDYDRIMELPKAEYALYFGRFSKEKGIETLLGTARALPEISFIFAGSGPMEHEVSAVENIENKGFVTGEALHKLIRQARFSIYPSEWYENCPFSVMESISFGTPVIGADIGGIPELVIQGETGVTYRSGDADELEKSIYDLWNDDEKIMDMEKKCIQNKYDTIEDYVEWLIKEVY